MKNPFYRFIRFMVWVFYPKLKVEGADNLPDEPAIIVGNHSQANGPIALQLYSPRQSYTWCISQMMHIKEVPAYAFEDFWSKKPKHTLWFYKFLSYVIAPIGSFIMTHADTIPVYKDKRVMHTFLESIDKLNSGADVVVFPECYDEHNNIVHEFQRGFVDVARLNYKRNNKVTPFVPLYLCPSLKKMIYGKPVYYNPEANPKEEAERICNELMDSITEIARSLPKHKVVPYNNVSKKYYQDSI